MMAFWAGSGKACDNWASPSARERLGILIALGGGALPDRSVL